MKMWALSLSVAAAGIAQPVTAQQNQPAGQDVQVLRVQGNVYAIAGGGANVAVQVGSDGVLVVDTSTAAMSEKILATIKTLSDKPIRWVINTHDHGDHTGGNAAISKAGKSIPQNAIGVGKLYSDQAETAPIVAQENVLKRMSAPTGKQALTTSDFWPTVTFFTEDKEMFFNDEPIQIIHQPAAHTDGDVLVFFRRSDVVVAGDIFVTTTYPMIDVQRGGTINGFVGALNRLIKITIPKEKQEDGTFVISGHGRIGDEADVADYRDMTTIIRDRIQAMVREGMTLEQVRAAKPTLDYDGRYGATTGPWTTDMFVEAVYRTLPRPAPQRSGDGGRAQQAAGQSR